MGMEKVWRWRGGVEIYRSTCRFGEEPCRNYTDVDLDAACKNRCRFRSISKNSCVSCLEKCLILLPTNNVEFYVDEI